ncbi:hypothetical protein ACFYXL_04820 [Streptomyces tsukubensis]|uniref:hypothetical protein n=1 Tax=Streptomyces tsukubensis TaxID=83656 RepID=UPI0036CF5F43
MFDSWQSNGAGGGMWVQHNRERQKVMAVLSAVALLLALGFTTKERILRYLDGGLLNTFDDCAATGPLEREIDALPFFAGPPPGTAPVRGFETPGASAGCLDDSGDELVTGHAVFRLTGDRQDVADRLRAVAERDGWTRGPVVSTEDDPHDPADLCFEKRLKNGDVVVTVGFAAVNSGPGAEKQVEVDAYSMLDGTATAC